MDIPLRAIIPIPTFMFNLLCNKTWSFLMSWPLIKNLHWEVNWRMGLPGHRSCPKKAARNGIVSCIYGVVHKPRKFLIMLPIKVASFIGLV